MLTQATFGTGALFSLSCCSYPSLLQENQNTQQCPSCAGACPAFAHLSANTIFIRTTGFKILLSMENGFGLTIAIFSCTKCLFKKCYTKQLLDNSKFWYSFSIEDSYNLTFVKWSNPVYKCVQTTKCVKQLPRMVINESI